MFLCVAAATAGSCDRGGDNRSDTTTTSASVEPAQGQWFTEITQGVGLDFVHETGAVGHQHLPEVMGAGAALFDFDNDGDLDIYLTNGNHTLPDGRTVAGPVNRLYRQESDGRFTDVTAESGLGDGGYGMGVAIGDIDNDGDADVYVTNLGPDQLYLNRGDGTFENVTAAAGIENDGWSGSATFFDYDLDGFLDLYVTQYVKFYGQQCYDSAGRHEYCGPKAYKPAHDVLMHNNGDLAAPGFTDVSEQAGISSMAAAGLGVVCEDWNDDGWPDVYVANDAYPNNLWINQGDGTFVDDALVLGAAYNLHGQSEAGMGVTAGDFDGDQDPDLFVTHLGQESNTLYRNLGPAIGFNDDTGTSGLGAASMAYTGFGTAAFDVELDGDLDLFIVNGRVRRGDLLPNTAVLPPWNIYAEPNLFYLNDGTGRFRSAGPAAASLCEPIEVTRGLAVGDVDSDGDVDLLVSNLQGRARLYRNDAPRQGHWLRVRAVDPRLKRDAIGARVSVWTGDRCVVRTIRRGFSYLSSSDPRAHFGLGNANRVDRILVRWPDGLEERFGAMPTDQAIELLRGTGEALP